VRRPRECLFNEAAVGGGEEVVTVNPTTNGSEGEHDDCEDCERKKPEVSDAGLRMMEFFEAKRREVWGYHLPGPWDR